MFEKEQTQVGISGRTGDNLLDTISRVQNLRGVGVYNGPLGTCIAQRPQRPVPPGRPFLFTKLRVDGFTTPTTLGGAKYWAVAQKKIADTSINADSNKLDMTEFWEDANETKLLLVNEYENGLPTHLLAEDAIVDAVYDGSTTDASPVTRYRCNIACDQVIAKVTGNASGGGQYTGEIATGTSNADGSGNLTTPEGLTFPGIANALILNLREDGTNFHSIGSGQCFTGTIRGVVDGGTHDGKAIVFIDSFALACQ